MKIVFIGVQGSGKGTQAKVIAQKLGLVHISTGDLFRGAKGEEKAKLDSYMNSGKLVPDTLVLEILKKRLDEADAQKGFILDGFPRNIEQAKALDEIVKIDNAFDIKISDEEALKRLSGRVTCEKCKAGYNLYTAPKPKNPEVCDVCGGKLVQRADDNPEAIKKRIEIYHTETAPIIKFYNTVKVNGEQSIEKVTEDIMKAVKMLTMFK